LKEKYFSASLATFFKRSLVLLCGLQKKAVYAEVTDTKHLNLWQ
jgi:hypothetical protein